MSLEYIMGGIGSGKTTLCIEKIISESKTSNVILIVPEQFTLSTEKMLIERLGVIINIQVLSFMRLSFHVLNELGNNKKLLDDTDKNILLRKILSETKLKCLNANTFGLAESLNATIKEFYQYGITPRNLKRVSCNDKLSDICKVYEQYVQTIREKYLSLDEVLDVLAEKIPQSNILDNTVIFIDGFDSFTVQQYKVLDALIKRTRHVVFTAAIHFNEQHLSNYNNVCLSDSHFEIKNTVNKLTSLAQNDIAIVSLNTSYKTHEMTFLTNNYFGDEKYEALTENIFVHTSSTEYAEVVYAARKIKQYIRNGYRYMNIAIIVSDINIYRNSFNQVFKDIPFFIDSNMNLSTHPISEFIRNAIDIVLNGMKYENAVCLFKTKLTDATLHEVDVFDNYVLENGITKWERSDKYDNEIVFSLRDKLLKMILPIQNEKLKIKTHCTNVFEMLYSANVIEQLESDNAEQNAKVWNELCLLFEKMVELLGETTVTLKQFAEMFEEGVANVSIGSIPKVHDQITIGEIERSRLHDIKILFMLGSEKLPCVFPNSSLLTDEEKYIFHMHGLELSPTINYKAFKSKFLVYSFLAKPTVQLNISCLDTHCEIVTHMQRLFPSLSCDVDVYSLEPITTSPKQTQIVLPITQTRLSAYKLEQYARCPFAFFVKHILKLRERKTNELLASDLGSLMHNALKLIIDSIEKSDGDIEKLIDNAISSLDIEKLNASPYSQYHLEKMKRILNKSLSVMLDNLTTESYKPLHTEFEFNDIKLCDGITLTGKIDRVDISSDGHIRIIDYKSSKRSLKSLADYIQLLVYMKVFENYKIDGAFFFHLHNPLIDVTTEPTHDEFQKLIANDFKLTGIKNSTTDEIVGIAMRLSNGIFNIEPCNENSCKYCLYHDICKINF